MTLGTAIFLSVLLLVIAWQIDKRKAWKKSFLWIIGLITVGGVVFGGWYGLQHLKEYRVQRSEAEAVRAGTLDTYWGLKLGMSKDEVRYLKGEPTANPPDDHAWIYGSLAVDKAGRIVLFNTANQAYAVICRGVYYWDCDPVGGIRVGDSESQVTEAFGSPTQAPKLMNGKKLLRFGPTGNWVVAVTFRQGIARELAVNAHRIRDGNAP